MSAAGKEPDQHDLEQASVTLGRVLKARRLKTLRLPNLIGVGSARCGTTYLYQLLRQHPEIYGAPGKELNYFGVLSRNAMTLREYTLLFMGQADQRYVAEVTPVYLHSRQSMEEMADALDRPKLLINVREPVSRLISHFKFFRDRHGFNDLAAYLDAAVAGELETKKWAAPSRAILQSLYAEAIERAFALFGRENCCVLNHADLAAGGEAWLPQLSEFLELDMSGVSGGGAINVTRSEAVGLPATAAAARVTDLFTEDAEHLSSLLGPDLVASWR